MAKPDWQEESIVRIVEPVGPQSPIPPSYKTVDGLIRSPDKTENVFMTIFQEVSGRCRPGAMRIPFLNGRRKRTL